LTTAARGGLRPAPDCRPRRALLHLSYSSAPFYADGAFVTHAPKRAFDQAHLAHDHPQSGKGGFVVEAYQPRIAGEIGGKGRERQLVVFIPVRRLPSANPTPTALGSRKALGEL
jgi:hypothetical protein